jgi:RNA polymerase sigma factor (sigma-70 family)
MDPAAATAVAEAHRRDWGFVLAATARITRDLDAAEDCVQDAYAQALASWPASGVPAKPAAWLTVVARRRAMNLIHRNDRLARKLPLLVDTAAVSGPGDRDDAAADTIPDDRLRLIFTCCYPALAAEARVALTLRLLCGLTTGEVASAFLVSEPTMAAQITRAKKNIAAARIPYRVPRSASYRTGSPRSLMWCTWCSLPGTPPRPDSPCSAETWPNGPSTWPGCCASSSPPTRPWPGCSPSSCLPMPAATPAPPPTGGCSCSPNKTAPAGTGPKSAKGLP